MADAVDTWKAFTYHWWVWRFCGLQPPPARSPWRRPYLVYSAALNLTVTLLFPTTLVVNCCLSENLNEFCENLYITITDVVCNLKFLNVLIVRQQLLQVRPILEKLDARARSPAERRVLGEGVASARRCFGTLFGLFGCAIVTSQLVVYLAKERTLMYPAWFPLDWRHSRRNFLLVHSYQLYGLVVQAVQDLGNDTYPQAYLTVLAAHFRALSIRIQSLGGDAHDGPRTPAANYEDLVECIRDHKVILDLYTKIQRIISSACLAQFVCTGLAQCTIGVYTLYVGLDISKLVNIAIFLSAVTFEIFILCYYGDRLCQESEQLSVAIYSCNWPDQSRQFKQALLVLLQRSQKTSVIMAGKMIPVRLPTFVQVVKTAYSVFTVLNEVK